MRRRRRERLGPRLRCGLLSGALAARLEPVRAEAVLNPAMLLCANLVSGVVDAQD